MSVVILRLLLFLLPFLLFGLWFYYRRYKQKGGEGIDTRQAEKRLIYMMVGVITAMIAIAGTMVMLQPGAPPGARYIPPHSVDGEIVPGRYVTEEEAAQIDAQKKDEF